MAYVYQKKQIEVCWDVFFNLLAAGNDVDIDETKWYFESDSDEAEHYLGHLSQYENPYWIGYCDEKNGCEFWTAIDLATAPVFDGRSLMERWDEVVLIDIGGVDAEEKLHTLAARWEVKTGQYIRTIDGRDIYVTEIIEPGKRYCGKAVFPESMSETVIDHGEIGYVRDEICKSVVVE